MRYRMIRTENLTKYYRNRLGVKDLTLEVEPGEIFGFLGPTGAGKTTTILLLLDMIHSSSGRAWIMGKDSHQHSLEIRQQVGYLPAQYNLFEKLSAGEMLRYLLALRREPNWNRARQLAEEFALDLARPVAALSAAEKQKIGLVQAFVHHPELLILDEPTRSLEPAAQQTFYRLVAQARADGRTVFFSSNSLIEMERICDRVAVIYRGNLVAVERGVQLRSRALRKIEMRFAGPVSAEAFRCLPNLKDLQVGDNSLSCTLSGDPDVLIKTASQFRVVDIVSQIPSLEEVFGNYYGVGGYAG